MAEMNTRVSIMPTEDGLVTTQSGAAPLNPPEFPQGPFFTDSGNSSSEVESEDESDGWGSADNGEVSSSDRGGDNSDGDSEESGGSSLLKLGKPEVVENSDGSAKKKKKRKKRKKKGLSEDEEDKEKEKNSVGGDRDKGMLPVLEADARYCATMESLRAKDETSLWVQLDKCRISDKKTKKIVEALGDSKGITSLDLSHNHITDQGIHLLTKALEAGLAPDLISLNLLGNPFSASSFPALLQLQRQRKQCRVEFQGGGDGKGGNAPPPTANEFNEGRPRGGGWEMEAGNGWGEDGGVMGRKVPKDKSKEATPVEKVDAALGAVGGGVGHFVDCLEAVLEVVLTEIKDEEHKISRAKDVQSLPGALRHIMRHLPRFLSVLELDLAPVECQRKVGEPPVGRARIGILQLLLLLLVPCVKCIDSELVALGVVLRAAELLFHFPWNTSAHVAVDKIVELVLSRPDSPLLPSLVAPLSLWLAQAGGAAEKEAQGRRRGNSGFVIRWSKQMRSLGKGHRASKVPEILASIPEWNEYTGVDGVLDRLLRAQQGVLGGEKPEGGPPGLGFESEEMKTAQVVNKMSAVYYEHFKHHGKKGH